MEFFQRILQLPLAELLSDLHGLLATLCLVLYGAIFVTIAVYRKYSLQNLHKPLVWLLGIQTLVLGAVSTAGIVIYVAYRSPGGAREFLLKSADTGWLHNIVFEYKEYLGALVPWLLLMVSFFLVIRLGKEMYKNRDALRLVLTNVIVSASFVLLTSCLAVLVAKMAPLEKFNAGADLFSKGSDIAVIGAFVTLIVIGGIFWLVNFALGKPGNEAGQGNSLASMMYGSAAGLTVEWILDWAQAASPSFKTAITYVPGIGQYSGVIMWSLVAIALVTLVVWLATMKLKRPLSLKAAGWVLVISALVQVVFFFAPFYHLFIK
jgi:hypothetical protein